MNISSLVNTVTKALETSKTPANILPPLLLKCVSLARPGMSVYKTAAEVIKNNALFDIPRGPNPDGSANKINQYTYNLCKCIIDAIKNDASVQAAIPSGSIMIESKGGNAGGPIVTVGRNLLDSICRGIIS